MANLRNSRQISGNMPRYGSPRSGLRRPFWLPASNYYVLAVAFSAAFFFLIWGILHDDGEETPWVTAGISASMLLAGAVVLREVVLRRARSRFIRQQRMLDDNLYGAFPRTSGTHDANKLTIEKNAAILNAIRQKSDAAKVLDKFSAGHREVFELCGEYLIRNDNELKTISAASPRLSVLLKGRATASKYHKYHMLRWAEIETKTLSNDARSLATPSKRIEAAQNAVQVIESALASYPEETTLVETHAFLNELAVSVKVSHWIEEAERALFKGDLSQAKNLYRDALFVLSRDNVQSEERQQAADHINAEIERIRSLESDKM
jgi:hypothetical protein